MPRITCKVPATARPVPIRLAPVPTVESWATLIEAPDFSVPDTALNFPVRDPLDTNRAIRPGEIYIMTPIKARNKDSVTRWIEARILQEGGTAVLLERIEVPAGDSVQIVTQGLSLLKRVAAGANGDRLQVRAETSTSFDVTGNAQERPSAEHIGVVV